MELTVCLCPANDRRVCAEHSPASGDSCANCGHSAACHQKGQNG